MSCQCAGISVCGMMAHIVMAQWWMVNESYSGNDSYRFIMYYYELSLGAKSFPPFGPCIGPCEKQAGMIKWDYNTLEHSAKHTITWEPCWGGNLKSSIPFSQGCRGMQRGTGGVWWDGVTLGDWNYCLCHVCCCVTYCCVAYCWLPVLRILWASTRSTEANNRQVTT